MLEFGVAICALSVVGVATNLTALVLLSRPRRHRSTFHRLLRLLSCLDLVVVVVCCLTYGLPNVSTEYEKRVFVWLSPGLVPAIHIAVTASVYCTVLISLERYIRICYLCQLRQSPCAITEDNVRYYMLAIIAAPALFYLPKFFEFNWDYAVYTYNVTLDCSSIALDAYERFSTNVSSAMLLGNNTTLINSSHDQSGVLLTPQEVQDLNDCLMTFKKINGTTIQFQLIVSRSRKYLEIMPTALRSSPLYYRLYMVLLNSLFMTLIPLALLLFLNISTVLSLKKMAKEEAALWTDSSLALVRVSKGESVSNNNHVRRDTVATVEGALEEEDGEEEEVKPLKKTPEVQRTTKVLSNEVTARHDNRPRSFSDSLHHLRRATSPNVLGARKISSDEVNTRRGQFAKSTSHHHLFRPLVHGQQSHRSRAFSSSNSLVMDGCASRGVAIDGASFVSTGRRGMHDQEKRLARISILIVWLFLACHSWKAVPTAYEWAHSENGLNVDSWPDWLEVIEHLSHTLIVFNSTTNFLIYAWS